MNELKTAVIGSGPAGLTAAIYLARAKLHPTVFAGESFGGQLMLTTMVENFPGFPEGIMGPDLMNNMFEQAKHFGADIVYQNVTKVNFTNRPLSVYVGDQEYTFDGVVLALGANPKKLELESEGRLTGKGVSYCATCDGAFFKDKEIAVIGGGDSAMEEAIFLTRFASKVHIIHRRESFRASKIMQEKALSNPKIDVLYDTEVAEILGEDKVTGIRIKNSKENTTSELPVGGVFIAIGYTPNTNILEDIVDLDAKGYLKLSPITTQTNKEGVFSAGEINDYKYRQAITAAGEGCKAALDLERYLSGISH
jgi:thioredoxin reductase (NADPH)